jgi:hypothetical protein
MFRMKSALPGEVSRLFWDTDAAAVDPATHRTFILDRVLEYGSLRAVQWAERFYGLEGIREYFLARGRRVLSAKTRSFWTAVLGLSDETCTPKSSPPHNNPLWPY